MSLPYTSKNIAAYNIVELRRNGSSDRKGKEGGQDKERRCAVPFSPGRCLVSQGFSGLNYDVRRNAAMFPLLGIAGFPQLRRTSRARS